MEPGTPTPVLKFGAAELPLAWTKRSEAVMSRYGFDIAELFECLGNRRKAMYAMCVGLHAALRPEHAPETPEEVAEWLTDDAARAQAIKDLVRIIKHARPELFRRTTEKKSDSKP